MANILDLLGDYKRTVKMNENISTIYIIYQAMLMVGTILSPGTIFLMVVGAMNTVMGLGNTVALLSNVVPILSFAIFCYYAKKNDHQIFFAQILSTCYGLLMLAVLVGTAIEILEKGPFTPNSIFFLSMLSSFLVAAIIHPQEFLCIIPCFLYLLCIPSMYLLLTIYSIINLHVVSWGTREVKSKLTAKEQAQLLEQQRMEAEAKAKQKSLFGFLNFQKLGNGSSGFFTCMCCSSSKAEEEAVKLAEINEKLSKVTESMDAIKSSVVALEPKRRGSSHLIKRQTSKMGDLETIESDNDEIEEETDKANTEDSASTARNSMQSTTVDNNRPKWTLDKDIVKFPINQLTPRELQFWADFIPKYLLPLDSDPKHEAMVLAQLKELRNKAVFAFAIMNTIFILFVFLLQMNQRTFGITIPARVIGHNITYDEQSDEYVDTPEYQYVIMDPIGLTLVVFFGSILLIQCIGMFMHRFGTLAHLLAFVDLHFWWQKKPTNQDDGAKLGKNAVAFTKQMQKLKGIEAIDEPVVSLDPKQRRLTLVPTAPQQLNLDDAFRKRMLSIVPESNGT